VSSELSRAVDQYGDRSIVNEFDAHCGLKLAGGHRQPRLSQFSHEIQVDSTSVCGRRRPVKRWSPALPDISVQRELRHHQHRTLNINHGAVQVLATFGVKETRIPYLAGQVLHVTGPIVSTDRHEYEKSASDLADEAIANIHARLGDPLHDSTHVSA
jgi:hypothetical protein